MADIVFLENHRKKKRTTLLAAGHQTEKSCIPDQRLLLPDVSIETLKALLDEMNGSRDRGTLPSS